MRSTLALALTLVAWFTLIELTDISSFFCARFATRLSRFGVERIENSKR